MYSFMQKINFNQDQILLFLALETVYTFSLLLRSLPVQSLSLQPILGLFNSYFNIKLRVTFSRKPNMAPKKIFYGNSRFVILTGIATMV